MHQPASAVAVGTPAAVTATGTAISNYEKALISAASSLYKQQSTGTFTAGRAAAAVQQQNTKLLPYWKQKRIRDQQTKDPNRPIVVSAFMSVCLKNVFDVSFIMHG